MDPICRLIRCILNDELTVVGPDSGTSGELSICEGSYLAMKAAKRLLELTDHEETDGV